MQSKINIDIENMIRMNEIAEIYDLTGQQEKSRNYHEKIVEICDRYPKSEKVLTLKINSLNYLEKSYKSLETTNELLNLNPYNIPALLNISLYLKE